jgi:hypothetical protein
VLLADLHWLEPAEATVVVLVVLLDSRLSEMQGQIASICSWATCSRRLLNSGRVTKDGAEDDSTSALWAARALSKHPTRVPLGSTSRLKRVGRGLGRNVVRSRSTLGSCPRLCRPSRLRPYD